MVGRKHPIAHVLLLTAIFIGITKENISVHAIAAKRPKPKIERPRHFDNGLKRKNSLCSTCKRHNDCLSLTCENEVCVSPQWSIETCLALRQAGKIKKKETGKTCQKCSNYWECVPSLCIHGRCARTFQERQRCVNETLSTPIPRSWELCDPCQGKPDDCPGGLCIRDLCVPNVQHLQFCQVHTRIKGATLIERNTSLAFKPDSVRSRRGGKKCTRCESWFQCESLRCRNGLCVDQNQYKSTPCQNGTGKGYDKHDGNDGSYQERSKGQKKGGGKSQKGNRKNEPKEQKKDRMRPKH